MNEAIAAVGHIAPASQTTGETTVALPTSAEIGRFQIAIGEPAASSDPGRFAAMVGRMDSAYEAVSARLDIGIGASGAPAAQGNGLDGLFDASQRIHAAAIDVSLWAMQVNMVTTLASKSTQGFQTLLNNQGG